MAFTKVLIVPKQDLAHGRLKLRSILAEAGFADVDPLREDVTIQIRNGDSEVLCATVGHDRWMRRHGRTYKFWEMTGRLAHGLTDGQIRVRRTGDVRFRTQGRRMNVAPFLASTLRVTVRVGNRCSTGKIELRTSRSRSLVFP